MPTPETITSTVTQVNGTGFQIEGRPGTWLRISQYAEPRPELPQTGQRVRIGLDSKGFVRTVEPVAADTPPAAAQAPSTRDTTITRLACLKAAAGFLASRPDAKSADVLTVAAAWEAWVTR